MNEWPRIAPTSAWVTLGCLVLLTVETVLMAVGIVAVVGWVL